MQKLLGTLVVGVLAGCAHGPSVKDESRCLRLAKQAGEWLASVAIEEKDGLRWPVAPGSDEKSSVSLYYGAPGVISFFLELHAVTGDPAWRAMAERGARWLAAQASPDLAYGGLFWLIDDEKRAHTADPGFYSGIAGIGATFLELHRLVPDGGYARYARGAADWLAASDSWKAVNDVISGAAGVGLFFLQAAEQLKEPQYREAAIRAGDFLLGQAMHEERGVRWRMSKEQPRLYPNFSHGTSGVAFFLAALARRTGEKRFHAAALEAVEWLKAKRCATETGAVWYRHEPDAKELYYPGWCHGPAGTARLFYELHRATGDAEWMQWVRECARWIVNSGIPEKRIDGFWNVSVCCGTAGVGEFFADLFRLTGDPEYRRRADAMVADLERRATPGPRGLKWLQAENRVSPDQLAAQTGYAQGAAGIGLFFLKMHALETGRPFAPRLADNPFLDE